MGRARPGLTAVAMHRMGDEEDPHAFQDIFSATARACVWPEEEWGVRLLPLLMGEAQRAALSLPAASRVRFTDLRRAVLEQTGGTAAEYRRRLRFMRLWMEDRPFAFSQRLQEAATRWLQPGEGEGQLLDQIIREQLLEAIPKKTADWFRYHRPHNLAAAVTLAEDHLARHWCRLAEGQPAPMPHGWSTRHEKESALHIPRLKSHDSPSVLSPQVLTAVPRTSPTQTAPQTLGQACWRDLSRWRWGTWPRWPALQCPPPTRVRRTVSRLTRLGAVLSQ
ncbi:uncharacterized protein LOC133539960 [Nerophis ophidion]|uniref:uncharacterized protein LOC133539960 n=1 Tax=Nerophis ophidion TaxID=159077 RepID=UPI002ADF8FE2|nr:uncharacterized protein LOC133539960 [Nerophis ophidion]